jgi:hypothetical protein
MDYQMNKAAVKSISVTDTLAAMTAGTVYTGYLTCAPVLDSGKGDIGGIGNTSMSSTNSVFVNAKSSPALVLANGDYFINYRTGYYTVKAGASATPAITYFVKALCTTALS